MTYDELIESAGRILGIEGLTSDAEGVVHLVSEDEDITIMHCPEVDDAVLFTARIAALPADPQDILRRALASNHAFAATRGATISLDTDDDSLHLSLYVGIERMTPELLLTKIGAFSSALFKLRESLFNETESSTAPANLEDQEPPLSSGFIQV